MPRPQFTLRTILIAVAVAAIWTVIVIQAAAYRKQYLK